jgi:hypothetical protein
LLGKVNEALALAGDVMTFDDLVQRARERKCQIWANDTALLATELLTYPKARHLDCFLGAGRLRGILDLQPQFESFAREHEVSQIITHGRPAWGLVGRRFGWQPESVRYVKRLED